MSCRLLRPSLLTLLLAVLLVPASASAQEPMPESATTGTLHVGQFDRQLTHVPLTFDCASAPNGSTCELTLHAKWRIVNSAKGTPKTKPVEFRTQAWSVPAGTTGSLMLDVTALHLKAKVVRSNGKYGALIDVSVVDSSGAEVDFGDAPGDLPRWHSGCHAPRSFPFSGGAVQQIGFDQKTYQPVYANKLDSEAEVIVGDEPITARIDGVSFEFAPHSRFFVTCGGLTDYAHNRSMPVIFLRTGEVHATGRPHGPMHLVTIFTPEGTLGSRSRETIDFIVTRDADGRISTLRVKIGHTTQITPRQSKTRSPCTNGQALSVDAEGRVHKL